MTPLMGRLTIIESRRGVRVMRLPEVSTYIVRGIVGPLRVQAANITQIFANEPVVQPDRCLAAGCTPALTYR
jgi:hypothetical protein